MIRKLLLAAVAGTVGFASIGTAAAQKFEYDCDTTPEHFSDLKLAADATARSVRATITAHAFYKSRKYLPAANLKLGAPDDSWWVMLTIGGTANAKAALAKLRVMRGGKVDEQPLGVLDASAPIAASLAIGADGEGTATLGGKSVRFTVAPGPATAGVSCSTGDFLFADLSFGD